MVNRQAIGADSEKAREAILSTLRAQPTGAMESVILDGTVAAECGVTVKTVRNLRSEFRDRGWIAYYPADPSDDDNPRRVWMVALTNSAPARLENPEAELPHPLVTEVLLDAGARVPDGQLGSTDLQGDLFEVPETPSAAEVSGTSTTEVPGTSEPEVSGTSTEVSGTSDLSALDSTCPVCGSTKIGTISGNCTQCGTKVNPQDKEVYGDE